MKRKDFETGAGSVLKVLYIVLPVTMLSLVNAQADFDNVSRRNGLIEGPVRVLAEDATLTETRAPH